MTDYFPYIPNVNEMQLLSFVEHMKFLQKTSESSLDV